MRKVVHKPLIQIDPEGEPWMGPGWRIYTLPGEDDRRRFTEARWTGTAHASACCRKDQAGLITMANVGGDAADLLCMELLPVLLESLPSGEGSGEQ